MATALTAAETGHLVFATLHTQSTSQTVDRIIDVFPPEQQAQVRTQLSIALQGIVTQQLLPTADGMGRIVACEVLVPTPAIRNLIREGKTHQIYAAVQTSGAVGMQTMDADLVRLVRAGKITRTLAEQRASVPEELKRLLGGARRRRPGRPRGQRRAGRGPAADVAPGLRPGGLADGGRDDIRLPRDGHGWGRHRRRARGRVQGPGQRAAAPARADRPRRQREVGAAEARGAPDPLEESRQAGAGGLLAPVRDPGRLRDADDPVAPDPRGADPGRQDPRGDRRACASDVEAGQHARAGDGALPRSLRPPVPGDGPLRRAVGPPRGGARPRRLPGRESRRPPAPGQIGADVPDPDLRLRDGRAAGRRRLRDPGLRQHLRRTRRRKPRRSRRACRCRPRSA